MAYQIVERSTAPMTIEKVSAPNSGKVTAIVTLLSVGLGFGIVGELWAVANTMTQEAKETAKEAKAECRRAYKAGYENGYEEGFEEGEESCDGTDPEPTGRKRKKVR